MFRGSFEHSVDSKGRVSVPARFRDILLERYEGKLVLTMDYDKCVMAYPLEEWERVEEKIKAAPQSQKEVKDYMRYVFSNAAECELDKQGRILIPPSLREGKTFVMTVPACTYYRESCVSGEFYLLVYILNSEKMPPFPTEGEYAWGMVQEPMTL